MEGLFGGEEHIAEEVSRERVSVEVSVSCCECSFKAFQLYPVSFGYFSNSVDS